MLLIIQRSLGFGLLIILGAYLRRKRTQHKSIFDTLSWLMTHVTLPCVIIVTMNGKAFSMDLLLLIPLGMLCNVVLLASCLPFVKGKKKQAVRMISISGFNIGCFALPLVNGLFSSQAMLGLCMFDLGNAIMCLGLNADIAALRNHGSISLKKLFENSLHSVPIWSYLLMLILCMMNMNMVSVAMPFIETAAAANPFLAMISIGMALNLHIHKKEVWDVLAGVLQRAVLCIIMAGLLYLLPFATELRLMLALLTLSPISAVSCVYARKLALDYEKAACINSLYILLSMVLICGFVMLFL